MTPAKVVAAKKKVSPIYAVQNAKKATNQLREANSSIVWAVYHEFAPSADIPADYKIFGVDSQFPATLKPDRLISVHDVMRAHRLYYEGVPFFARCTLFEILSF